jgi:hypothetical protein
MTITIRRALMLLPIVMTLAGPSAAQAVRVPGTRVTITPPEGFSPAQQYPGFERPEAQASIMVTELPVPAAAMMRSMTTPALASKGMVLISARDVSINQRPARLLHVRQQAAAGEVLKWMLVAGDAKTSVMVVGAFGEASSDMGDAIRRSLLTVAWGSAEPADEFEGLPFRVTPTARMKLARRLSNMLMFTESGTTGSPGSTEALYIAGHSIGRGQIADVQGFSESRAKQTTLIKGIANFSGRQVQIAGMDGYELEADATDARSGRAMRLYQVIIPDATGYYILQGLSRADHARELFAEFRTLTASFRVIASR